ncbi:hypothetical protein BGZ76_005032 [Entomortierella beljakovae]|nr:hypothetical protein BGZ76_005032 [Entomortierella beljakovae]
MSAQNYIISRGKPASARPLAVSKEWNEWVTSIIQNGSTEWRSVALTMPMISKADVMHWAKQELAPESSLASSSNNPSSENSSSSSTPSSSLSTNFSLNAADLENMRSEFKIHYERYDGDSWVLASGTDVDKTLSKHILTLDVEEPLHSFIIDETRSLISLFTIDDWKILNDLIKQADTKEESKLLPDWKRQVLKCYSLPFEDFKNIWISGWGGIGKSVIEDVIRGAINEAEMTSFCQMFNEAMMRLLSIYRRSNFELPKDQSEHWYSTKIWSIFFDLIVDGSELLELDSGEVHSRASALRKNRSRNLQHRQATGRKIDGLIKCKEFSFEFGAIEIGKKDKGPTGTKSLTDCRKLAKLLKDMFDLMYTKCGGSDYVLSNLRVYGFLISGSRVELISFRYQEGRFYRLVKEQELCIPRTLNNGGHKLLIKIAVQFLLIRYRMESMVQFIQGCIHPNSEDELFETLPANSEPLVFTLTTPPNSPKTNKRRKLSNAEEKELEEFEL